MTAAECLAAAKAAGDHYQLPISAFVDEFRRASPEGRASRLADPISGDGPLEGLMAAVASALCRESGTPPPEWVATTGSREPFFAFPARTFALRVRLMFESPPPFRIRRVFVPSDYMRRA